MTRRDDEFAAMLPTQSSGRSGRSRRPAPAKGESAAQPHPDDVAAGKGGISTATLATPGGSGSATTTPEPGPSQVEETAPAAALRPRTRRPPRRPSGATQQPEPTAADQDERPLLDQLDDDELGTVATDGLTAIAEPIDLDDDPVDLGIHTDQQQAAGRPRRRWPRLPWRPSTAKDPKATATTAAQDVPDADAPPNKRAQRRAERKEQRAQAVAFSDALGGRRRLQKLFRWGVAAAVVVVLVAGVLAIVRPPAQTTNTAAITEAARAAAAGTGFPTQTAETAAIRFAQTYYTWNGNDRDAKTARTKALASYLPASVSDGWDGKGVQSVVSGPYVAQATGSTDNHNGVVILALQLDSGAWIYPRIMIYADDSGAVAVAATPVLGPSAGRASFPGIDPTLNTDIDKNASADLAVVLNGFFTAWAASDTAALDRYVAQNATPQARRGLGGAVTLGEVSNVAVSAETNPDGTRTAVATVQWISGDPAQPTAARTTQTYRLFVIKDGSLWSVQHLNAGTPGSGSG